MEYVRNDEVLRPMTDVTMIQKRRRLTTYIATQPLPFIINGDVESRWGQDSRQSPRLKKSERWDWTFLTYASESHTRPRGTCHNCWQPSLIGDGI